MSSSYHINHGIDLGTTNSSIVEMIRGKPKVIKNIMQHDTTPSAVAFLGAKKVTGEQARNVCRREDAVVLARGEGGEKYESNAAVEFKRTMGTDFTYPLSGTSFNSEELSAEVLKALREDVSQKAPPVAAVVTIPADFDVNQQEATINAAKIASIEQCHLLQEPVAAAIAYGLTPSKSSSEKWLIFDFGGGTFDAALALVEDGQIVIKDTEGDKQLGGKDLDFSVADRILLEHLRGEHDLDALLSRKSDRERLRKVLKWYAEEAIIYLSRSDHYEVLTDLDREIVLPDGRKIDLEVKVTREMLRSVVEPFFQRAIDKTQKLMSRHGLHGTDIDELILVGGSTYSPILRQMLSEQIRSPNVSMDPMTVVACGAAFFASTIELSEKAAHLTGRGDVSDSVLHLDVKYEATSINDREFVTLKCCDVSDLRRFETLNVEMRRQGWRSGVQPLGIDTVSLEVTLEPNTSNVFDLVVQTVRGIRIETSPSEITITQGIKLTGSPLPHSLGIEIKEGSGVQQKRIFQPLRGAEKSKPMPAEGTLRGLLTTQRVRPGMPDDHLLISIFEDELGLGAGVRPHLCKHIRDYRLSGLQVNRVIPAGTRFDLTIVASGASGQSFNSVPLTVRVKFPDHNDEEFDLELSDENKAAHTDWIDREVAEIRVQIRQLHAIGYADASMVDQHDQKISGAVTEIDQSCSRDALDKGIRRLKEAIQEFYNFVDSNEWSHVEIELNKVWDDLKKANAEEGYEDSEAEMQERHERLNYVKEERDLKLARDLIKDLRRRISVLKRCEWSKQYIAWAWQNLKIINWANTDQAQKEATRGMKALTADKPCSELLMHARTISELVVRNADEYADEYTGPPIPQL